MNNELQRIWKKGVLDLIYRTGAILVFSWRDWVNLRETVKIAGSSADIWTDRLPNTSQKCYRLY